MGVGVESGCEGCDGWILSRMIIIKFGLLEVRMCWSLGI